MAELGALRKALMQILSRKAVLSVTAAKISVAGLALLGLKSSDGVTVVAQESGGPSEGHPATNSSTAPVDTDLRTNLRCPPVPSNVEQIHGIHFFDPAAHSGYGTPEQALDAHLQSNWPPGETKGFKLSGRNASMARFENGRAILLAHHLVDGHWYVTEGNSCWNVPYGRTG